MAAHPARSVYALGYDSLEQRLRVSLSGDDETLSDWFLARLRLDVIVSQTIDLTDVQLLDGALFLRSDPHRLRLDLPTPHSVHAALPMTVWSRRPSLIESLAEVVRGPMERGEAFEFSAIGDDEASERMVRRQEELSVDEFDDRLRRSADPVALLDELMTEAEVDDGTRSQLTEGWRRWMDAEAQGLVVVRPWGSDPVRNREFDLAAVIRTEPPERLGDDMLTEMGRSFVRLLSAELGGPGPVRPARSALLRHLQRHAGEWRGEGGAVALSGEEALDYVEVIHWFNRHWGRSIARQHGSTDFDANALAGRAQLDQPHHLDGSPALPLRPEHALGLAQLPGSRLQAWSLEHQHLLQRWWWGEPGADAARAIDDLRRALDSLWPLLTDQHLPPAPRGRRFIKVFGESLVLETLGLVLKAPPGSGTVLSTATTVGRDLLRQAAIRRASSSDSVTEYVLGRS